MNAILSEFQKEANKRAISFLNHYFTNPCDLKYISVLVYQCHQRIHLIQIEQRAILKKYNQHCHKMYTNILSIHQAIQQMKQNMIQCKQSQNILSRPLYKCAIKSIHARQNMDAIIYQINECENMFSIIRYLNHRMTNSSNIDHISKEFYYPNRKDIDAIIVLERWKYKIHKEIQRLDKEQHLWNQIKYNSPHFSSYMKRQIHHQNTQPSYSIMDYFHQAMTNIETISNHIRDTIHEYMMNCIPLGQKYPQFLIHIVHCFEYIAQYEDDRNQDSLYRQKTINQLIASFGIQIQQQFSSFMYQAVDNNMSNVQAALGASSNGLVHFIIFKGDINPCFPESYRLIEIYQQQFEQSIIPQIKALYYRNMQDLTVQDILQIYTWLEYYQSQIQLINPNTTLHEDIKDGIKSLMHEYNIKIGHQIHDWFDHIVQREKNIFQDIDGLYISNDPADIITCINIQMSLARDHFPTSFMTQLKTSFIKEIRLLNQRVKDDIDNKWENMEFEVLCSIVNDGSIMQEKCECLFITDDDDHDASLREKVNDLCVHYIELSAHAVTCLSRKVHADMKHPVLSRIFSNEWENGEPLVDIGIHTLEDYFRDFQVWLTPYFLQKCWIKCFEYMLQTYVHVCFTPRQYKPSSCLLSSQRLSTDRIQILNAIEKNVKSSNEKSILIARLDILKSLSKLMICTEVDDAYQDVNTILRCLPNDTGANAMIYFLESKTESIKKDHSRWLNVVNEVFELQVVDKKKDCFFLPCSIGINDNIQHSRDRTSDVYSEDKNNYFNNDNDFIHATQSTPVSFKEAKKLQNKKLKFSLIKGWVSDTRSKIKPKKLKVGMIKLQSKAKMSQAFSKTNFK